MRAVLFFDSMVTPRIVTFLYWLLLLAVAAAGVATAIRVGPQTFAGVACGLVVVAGGAVGVRVACELLIVLFRIDAHIETVSNRL
jgi:Domain of unknown function (DUF4282)